MIHVWKTYYMIIKYSHTFVVVERNEHEANNSWDGKVGGGFHCF